MTGISKSQLIVITTEGERTISASTTKIQRDAEAEEVEQQDRGDDARPAPVSGRKPRTRPMATTITDEIV